MFADLGFKIGVFAVVHGIFAEFWDSGGGVLWHFAGFRTVMSICGLLGL